MGGIRAIMFPTAVAISGHCTSTRPELMTEADAIGLKARHVTARPEGPGKRPPKINPAL